MGYGYGGFDGSFILFLILILLVFGTGFFFPGYYYGAEKK